MSWKKVSLKELCKMNSGGTPRRGNPKFYGGGIPWAKIGDIESAKSGIICETSESITSEGLKSISNRIFPKGTLLLAMYGSVGKVAFTGTEMSTNQAILGIRIKNEEILNYSYLKYWFETIKDELLNRAVGVALQNISLGIVKELEIPLPPLHIQKQIANILDKADALRKKDHELLQKYDELAQSIFIDMFGDPVKNEKGWEVENFGDYIDKLIAGNSYGGEDKILSEDELGVLKVSAVTSGTFRPDQYKAINKNLIQKNVIKVKKGDLLFSRANTRELVGATCVVDQDYDHLFLPDKLWRIDLNKHKCRNYFIKFLLSQECIRYNLNKTATGTSGSMLNISMQKLRDLEIIMPELSFQMEFENVIANLLQQRKINSHSLDQTDLLFQCLLQKAITGELIQEALLKK